MTFLIFALGVALAVAGAVSVYFGYPYMQVEWGWTEVIAGTTALSAGVVTIALGSVLLRLASFQKAVERAAGHRLSSAEKPIDALGEPGSGSPRSGIEPEDAARSSNQGSQTSPRGPNHEPARPVAAPQRPVSKRPLLTRFVRRFGPAASEASRVADPPADHHAEPGPGAPELFASSGEPGAPVGALLRGSVEGSDPAEAGDKRVPQPAVGTFGEEAVGPNAVQGGEPGLTTIVGRYESGGATYVLFSDGAIEVDTESGVHRFGSMEELRAFIDRQQPQPAGGAGE